MLLKIVEGKPVFVFDQLMMVKEFREVFNHYQEGSLEYIILYGWAGSPFVSIEDPRLRNEAVLLELKSTDWSMEIEKLESAKLLWDRPIVKAAILKINELFELKFLKRALFYKDEINKATEMLNQTAKAYEEASKGVKVYNNDGTNHTVKTGMDPNDIKTIVNTKMAIIKQIKELEKDYEEEMASARNFMESKTECSINHFIDL
jgi:hypothetical protein